MQGLGETRPIIVCEPMVPPNCTRPGSWRRQYRRERVISLSGLRQYERSCNKQHEAVSQVLSAKENVSYQQKLTLNSHSFTISLYHNLNIHSLIAMSHSTQSPLRKPLLD